MKDKRDKKKKVSYICNECGTEHDNEEDYLKHIEDGCDEVT